MIVLDEKGVIRSFSGATVRLLSWSPHEVVGTNASRLMPEPYRAEHDRYIERYLTNRERHIIGIGRIVVVERSDRSTFPTELAVGEAKVGGERFFGFIRNLTERRAQKRPLQELQSELVHTSRLTAMGEMASSIANGINRPLSAIANYMRGTKALLAPDRPDANRTADAQHAARQALGVNFIIKRLREFVAEGEMEHAVENPLTLLEEAVALALVGPKEQAVRVAIRSGRDRHQ
ncbi:PAS domain S-box protein [Bradyrhizobium zhanjiangense]|uniref:PAS domain S-box protein n=1 Tax=Bradyrhizobium zhanjiangense TaxID=1325107 RepID=UPI001FE12AC8|nr:PAS domain S-box protein [Bradyrhizobium zhanjiangense]